MGSTTLPAADKYYVKIDPVGDARVVTLDSGEQFLCPNDRAADNCAEARGGIIDRATIFRVPKEICGEYRWRPDTKTYWREWKYITDADTQGPWLVFGNDFLAKEIEPREVLVYQDGKALMYAKSLIELYAYRGIGKSFFSNVLIRMFVYVGDLM